MTGSQDARKVALMRPIPIPYLAPTSPRRLRGLDPAARSEPPTVSGSGLVALVVDDEPKVGELMAVALGSQGWRTVVATAAEEATALARDHAIDLLVTDLQMPGMSGLDLATLLRERHANLPVVLMSGWPEATTFELAQPFVFLRKPFRLQGIFEAIASLSAGQPNPLPVQDASQG
jgi:CheY-like chemotaxis protein